MSELVRMGSDLDNIKKSIERIELAVCGDKDAGIEGLVNKVAKHDKIINIWQRGIYIATGAGLVFGIIWKAITK